jgi:hypothetical protein
MYDHLLSLRRLSLQGRPLSFDQAFLSWRRTEFGSSWAGTVRGGSLDGLDFGDDEVTLEGETLDGRSVAGKALLRRPEGPSAPLQIDGQGPLVVAGREL